MLSPKFERVKDQYPRLSDLLDHLGAYIRTQIGSGQQFIIPKLAAAALQLNDGEAFVLLDMLAAGDVLRRVYNVYCRSNQALLATVESLEALDEVSRCDFCDTDHSPSDLKVEVAFSLNSQKPRNLAA